ncbi:hypothetical protein [Paenibacillus planticolens]|uniref:Uncharacterized protein n=1 Tax=Paenibacillus planticolens TaxID=2654976 RepID=A0ABX1ZFM3_9BACL|nr:hypothetical protein [Paenibacillus planticolens]NOU98675.1 hypothetical protein [Paenibacillus planticolens]
MRERINVIGALFIIVSGLIYTIERATVYIAGNITLAGFYAGRMSGVVPDPRMPAFSDNIFAPIFLLIGIIIIGVALFKRKLFDYANVKR